MSFLGEGGTDLNCLRKVGEAGDGTRVLYPVVEAAAHTAFNIYGKLARVTSLVNECHVFARVRLLTGR